MSKFNLRNLIDSYYLIFNNLDVFEISSKRKMTFDCIIEAGCHDGSDSVQLNRFFNPSKYLAFEPDYVARERAKKLFKAMNIGTIELHNYGLSNTNSRKFLVYEAEGKGSGSTHISEDGEDAIEVKIFDDYFDSDLGVSLLWLDVEGHALQTLEGMRATLKNVSLARVETQLHTRNDYFKKDYTDVIKLMKRYSLYPIYGPIFPGFFGDFIFVHSKYMTPRDKFRSFSLLVHLKLLHQGLYPLLGKPKTTN